MLVSPVVVVDVVVVVVVVLVQPIVPNSLIPAHWPAVYDISWDMATLVDCTDETLFLP